MITIIQNNERKHKNKKIKKNKQHDVGWKG